MTSMDRLRFGTAGIPLSVKESTTAGGIKRVHELGLSNMEMEFVQSVYVTPKKAPEIKEVAEKHDIVLTCHSPYFINLNAIEKQKIGMSKHHILEASRMTALCGGWSSCFHAGYYLKMDKEAVYRTIKQHLQEIIKTLQDEGVKIWVRPELTGKATQWGDLDEILKISAELDMMMPCIDFAHYHARYGGKNNTSEEFAAALRAVEKHLGKEGLQNMHIHIAGINYTDKGERNHLNLKDSDMNYTDLVKAWKDFKVKGVVVCESPNIEQDALLLQETYEKM